VLAAAHSRSLQTAEHVQEVTNMNTSNDSTNDKENNGKVKQRPKGLKGMSAMQVSSFLH